MNLKTLQSQLRPSHAYAIGAAGAVQALREAYRDCNPKDEYEHMAFTLATEESALKIALATRDLALALHEYPELTDELRDLVARGLGEVRVLALFSRLYRKGVV